MPRSLFAGIAFAGLSLISSAHAQTNRSLPSAEAILDRSVAASGGQAAYDRVQSEVRRMTAIASGVPVARTVIYRTRTGQFREIAQGSGGQSDLGVNDGVAWTRTAETAQIFETGEDRAQALQSAELLPDGHWRQFYKSVETVGTDTVEGKPCYKVRVVPFVGAAHTLWYDQRSGLQVKESEPVPGDGEAEMTAEEYFDAGGIKVPRRLRTRMNGVDLTLSIDEVTFNQALPEATFALPVEIQRLMKKRFAAK